jgi:hypothetical protein
MFKNPLTHLHIPDKANKKMIGNPKYISINSQMRHEQSRRDDLESLGYTLIYLINGFLPWQGIDGASIKERNTLIMDKKVEADYELLCQGLPQEFKQFMNYCKGLTFDSRPDYNLLRKSFKECFNKTYSATNFRFDWNLMCINTDNMILKFKDSPGTIGGSQKAGFPIPIPQNSLKTKDFDIKKMMSEFRFKKTNTKEQNQTDLAKSPSLSQAETIHKSFPLLQEETKHTVKEEFNPTHHDMALIRRISKKMTRQESCNFQLAETLEDLSVFCIYFLKANN